MQKTKTTKTIKGFTILEISIVLVIVALLVAGILGGQDLIKSMKINSTIAQMNEITAATNSFKLKYDSLPGDMPDATDYWGANGNCDISSNANLLNQVETCNGDNDGVIEAYIDYNAYSMYEINLFWQHLKIAELIDNAETKFIQPYYYHQYSTNINDIRISIFNGYWYNSYLQGCLPNCTRKYSAKNSFLAGATVDDSAWSMGPIIDPEFAFGIDNKLDDGMPDSGSVLGENYGIIGCANSSSPPQYDLSNPNNKCAVIIDSSF